MKFIIIGSVLLMNTMAFADSAKFSVPAFKGELVSNPAGLKIERMVLQARIQHCNFWGTTCAGDPAEEKAEELQFKRNAATNIVSFELKKSIRLRSFKPTNRFSSCNVSVSILARNEKGEKYEGYIKIIHENDKATCEADLEIKEQIAETFKVPYRANFWQQIR